LLAVACLLDFPFREAHIASVFDHFLRGAFVDGKKLPFASARLDDGMLHRKRPDKELILFRTHCAGVRGIDPEYCGWIVTVGSDIYYNLGMIGAKLLG
jgi:hypothetical protein